jgi:hypothetical protein
MKRSELRKIIREEMQNLNEKFNHKTERSEFEVRSFKEFQESQRGNASHYPDYFLVNKKNKKIEAGYGSGNIPNYSKYAPRKNSNYVIVSKSVLDDTEGRYDIGPIDYKKEKNWAN